MRLLIFLQGTLIMHQSGLKLTRGERVAQSRVGEDPSLGDPATYVPINDAAGKVRAWQAQGAQVEYLTSHRSPADVALDTAVLNRYGFPPGRVLFRRPGATYGDVVGLALPDLLIEDTCESIGEGEIAYFQLSSESRSRIRSIIVPEFGGIDHLPDSLSALAGLAQPVVSDST